MSIQVAKQTSENTVHTFTSTFPTSSRSSLEHFSGRRNLLLSDIAPHVSVVIAIARPGVPIRKVASEIAQVVAGLHVAKPRENFHDRPESSSEGAMRSYPLIARNVLRSFLSSLRVQQVTDVCPKSIPARTQTLREQASTFTRVA